MTVVHPSSISGISSLTTAASSEVLSFHINNTSERLRITAGGMNVTGVVTATSFDGPVSSATGDFSIADAIVHTGDTDTKIRFPGANQITFETGGVQRLELNNYGTYQPATVPLAFLATSGDSPNIKSGGTNANDLLFTAGNTERLRIASNGKISQGNHTASYEYDLRGTGLQSILIGSTNAAGAMLILDGDSNGDGAGTDYGSISHKSDASLEINNRKSGDIVFKNTSSETERLRITSSGINVTGVTTSKSYDLSSVSKTFTFPTHGVTDASATTNSIFVYDTRKDSDGGAWRKRTSDKSWYNEPSVVGVNTYCGARSEFPSVAVIIGAERGIFIHDGDDPDLPLWRSYAYDGNNPQPGFYYVMDNFKITAKNGIIAAARNDNTITNGGGLHFLDFILDKAVLISSNYGGQTAYDTPELTRTSMQRGHSYTRTIYTSGGTYGDIQDANAISVDMEVLPNAPTKMFGAERKIPTPTFVVGLNNGLTVIDHYGRCHDLYGSSQSSPSVECTDVSITKDGYIAYSHGYGTEWNTIITSNTTATYYNGTAGYQGRITNGTTHYGNTRCFAIGAVIYTKAPTSTFAISRSTDGLTLNRCEVPGFRDSDDSRRTAIIRYNSNSGWMVGDCRMACLASADSTNLTNGQSDPSREMQYSNSLTATGTVTKTAVATGAELMGYSGWSDSNYLSRTYDADFNFGATQFTVMFWAKDPDDTLKYITARGDADATETWRIGLDRNSGVYFDYGNGGSYAQSNMTLYTDWAFYVCTVHAGQKGHIYVNGNEQTYTQQGDAPSTFMNDTDWTLTVGRHPYGSGSAFPGSIALFRVLGDVPTEKVIREIYNDERQLFHQNAKCTLTGTQNSIVDMDYDDSTDTVHVGTSAGRSDFQGLVRINNTSTAVNSSVSASGGLIVEE